MKTRGYNNELRRRRQVELKERIAAATAELHAAKGVIATSYADIARHAGVSLPTVHKHFPTQDELLRSCTGHVIARAPAIPVEQILAATDLPAAGRLVVAAMEKQHMHFEPWLVWREDRILPFLARMTDGIRQAHAMLVEEILKTHGVRRGLRETAAAWESLLCFDFWHRLVRGHRISRAAARRMIVQCLLAAVAPASAGQP